MTTNISLTSGMKLAMMETDTLFEHHTVKEIQDIEKKIRNDIERKKEDLRQMVGERYRDLMEAADKITEMKVNSEKVNKHILAMETICKRLEHWNIQPKLHTSESPRKLETEILYGLVAQVNLLVQAPIKMWEMLENNEYLNAVLVFLLARHTHTSLVLMPSNKVSAATVVKLFPVISRQWAVIKPFQTSILQVCQKALISQDISEEDVSKALACIVLLSDSTPEAVFREYMEARKVAVQQMFKPERQGTTTKVLVCELVLLVVKTLHAVHRVCYASEETTKTFEGGTGSTVNDLLIKTLIEVTKRIVLVLFHY
ncbi:conserved oligomeric Golgi complex subunit 1-like [Limulus polyphemus]|uniref:Conserved oligomeric Golgi complex subunit 1 n=1 Tax=Limulus polyphemus TaxID=6850 RepID=A0ABM1TPZ1_LIMPO|nr:conserved oligomeric Golgi complex subunit 1-like [Limulus polyphemus]